MLNGAIAAINAHVAQAGAQLEPLVRTAPSSPSSFVWMHPSDTQQTHPFLKKKKKKKRPTQPPFTAKTTQERVQEVVAQGDASKTLLLSLIHLKRVEIVVDAQGTKAYKLWK